MLENFRDDEERDDGVHIYWTDVSLRRKGGVVCGVRWRREKVRLEEVDSGEERQYGRDIKCRRERITPAVGVGGGMLSQCCG